MTPHLTPQQRRVLAAARAFNGTCAADFAAPHVTDGQKPIMRVPARIGELETLGYRFEVIGRRGSTKVWRLAGVEAAPSSSGLVPPGSDEKDARGHLSTEQTLFRIGPPQMSAYEYDVRGEAA